MLYLREPMIPGVSLRGGAIMAAIAGAAARAVPAARRSRPSAQPTGLLVQMFFLGAGFMLVETKAVVHMALLFGGTWIVNSVVIFAVLVMILVANLFVRDRASRGGWRVYYAGAARRRSSSARWCRWTRSWAWIARRKSRRHQLLAFTPIFFAGVIFAVVVHDGGRARSRLRRQHRRRDVRRPRRIQLDAARLPVSAVRRGRALHHLDRRLSESR